MVEAFKVTTQAQAEQDAATRRADAVRTQAQAARDAAVLNAEGQRAAALIPVDVSRQEVEVQAARVAVERQDLENKSTFESIARELQVQLAQIAAGKDVEVARANAMGSAMAAAHITLYGDPATLSQIMAAFNTGQRAGALLEGLNGSAPQGAKDLIQGLAGAVVAIAEQKFGLKLTPDVATDLATQAVNLAATGAKKS